MKTDRSIDLSQDAAQDTRRTLTVDGDEGRVHAAEEWGYDYPT
jgi:hypothetical protein